MIVFISWVVNVYGTLILIIIIAKDDVNLINYAKENVQLNCCHFNW